MRGFILTPTYRVRDGVPEVHLYGVLESGEPCLIIDDRVRPYFFLRAADRGAVERVAPELRLSETDLHTFTEEPVLRVTVDVPGEVPALRGRLEGAGVMCLEADVRFAYRYLIDRGIRGAFAVHGICGIFGTLAVGFFATGDYGVDGLFYGGGTDQLVSQLIGSATVIVATAVVGLLLMFGIRAIGMLRISEEEERQGLDIAEHGSPAYHPEYAYMGYSTVGMELADRTAGAGAGPMPAVPETTT